MDAVDRLFALVDEKYREQKDFAAEIGVIPQRVSAWRKRTSKSYTKYLPQITAALDTTAEYILTGKEESPAPEGAGLTQEFARIFDQLCLIRGGQGCKQVQRIVAVRIGHGASGLIAHKYLQSYSQGQKLRP